MDSQISHLLDGPRSSFESQLRPWLEDRGESRFRLEQIRQQLFERRTDDPAAMSNLPQELRRALATGPLRPTFSRIDQLHSSDGTRKYGFRLNDGALVEAVWIPDGARGTLCVSSQAGCPARCTFCATGAGGYRRNLSPSEILGQWLAVLADLRTGDVDAGDGDAGDGDAGNLGDITQIVFMGMGEPLLNYEAVSRTLKTLTGGDGFQFSPRRVTVSTVGVAGNMERLVTDFPQIRLALSLHSAITTTRRQIVPMTRKYGLDQLEEMLVRLRPLGRRVTLEYVLLNGVNDSSDEAKALARFAERTAGHVNLLPFHPFPGAPYAPTSKKELEEFRRQVLRHGYGGEVTLRRSRGLDIQGACGQLALE